MTKKRLPKGTIAKKRRVLQKGAPYPRIVRKRDPITSHLAAARYILGPGSTRAKQVLYLVAQFPEHTNGEYAKLMQRAWPKLPWMTCCNTPHKRLSDLCKKRLIQVVSMRACAETTYDARTWELTSLGINEMRSIRKEEL